MAVNKAILLDNLLDQAAIQLQYRLGLYNDNNPLDNSLETEYVVKIQDEKFTVYEPTALRLIIENPGNVELVGIKGVKTVQDYTTTSQLP